MGEVVSLEQHRRERIGRKIAACMMDALGGQLTPVTDDAIDLSHLLDDAQTIDLRNFGDTVALTRNGEIVG